MQACIAKTRLSGRIGLSFNLELDDPIEKFLEDDQSWKGISGNYTIHLGEESSASEGHDASLPLLKASVSGFSRLWLGCSSATSISLGGEIEAEEELIRALDNTLCLPAPKAGWEY